MFIFKGKSSIEMGVIAKTEAFLGKARMRTEVISIDGRSGSIINELGYDDFSSTLSGVIIMNESNRDEVLEWLSGPGVLEYLGKRTLIRFDSSYIVAKHQMTFDVSFTRSPFWHLNDEFSIANGTVENLGNVNSQPLIRLTKKIENTTEVTIAGIRFKYTFGEGDTHVDIDCFTGNATFNGFRRNRNLEIGWDFPLLSPGKNPIVIHSGPIDISLKWKDRYL